MPSNVPGVVSRKHASPTIQVIRFPFTFADAGKVLKTPLSIPANALLIKPMCGIFVNVAFNAGTSNTVNIGIDGGSASQYLSVGSLASIQFVPFAQVVSQLLANDSVLTVTPNLTGTAATAGAAEAVFAFVPWQDAYNT